MIQQQAELLRAALRGLRRATGLPVAFASTATGVGGARSLRIIELSGTRTDSLRGLDVVHGRGLGGKAAALARPVAVRDYRSASAISHDYDPAVTAEGLGPMLAVPVVVGRSTRAVLYGALREPLALGDRVLDAASSAARDLGQALAVRDASTPCAADWDEVRAAQGELARLAEATDDPRFAARVRAIGARLARATGEAPAAAPSVSLSRRELDVLLRVATGATNAQAAAALGLRPETVKSYLRSAMRKLGAHNRVAAISAAREAGLLAP